MVQETCSGLSFAGPNMSRSRISSLTILECAPHWNFIKTLAPLNTKQSLHRSLAFCVAFSEIRHALVLPSSSAMDSVIAADALSIFGGEHLGPSGVSKILSTEVPFEAGRTINRS